MTETRIEMMMIAISGGAERDSRRTRVLLLALVACALAAALWLPSPASAAFGIVPGSFDVEVIDRGPPDVPFGGTPFAVDQSGAHPDEIVTRFALNSRLNSRGQQEVDGNLRNVAVDLPAGFAGDPTIVPRCTIEQLTPPNNCPDSSQVGFTVLTDAEGDPTTLPIYNMVPPADVPARFSFRHISGIVNLDATVRTGSDYGITVVVRNAPSLGVTTVDTTFWGVPADPAHDDERGFPGSGFCGDGTSTPPCPSQAQVKPFLSMPTRCSAAPLRTSLRLESWEGSADSAFSDSHLPDDPNTAEDESETPVGLSGCENLDFRPSIEVQPTSTLADAPTGLAVTLSLPQNEDPNGRTAAHLKKAVVTLPEGMSVNPSSANGLDACSPAQIGLDNDSSPTCPEASKIGSVEVDTPLLDQPLTGSVFVAKQNDNPFRSLLAIYIVAEGPGVVVKLPGHVDPDPVTGQLETTFDNNPQLPFNTFTVRFKAGPRAPLANPPTCGTKTATTEMSPWSGTAPTHPSDTFTIDCPGVSGFAPTFDAGTTLPVGGAFSPFAVRINRPDRQQYLRGLTIEMPPGLTAKLKDVPLCSDADANAGTCDVGSKIGTMVVGAGAGSHPFYTAPEHGSVYLTGPYKGAPFGLSVVARAIAGPYDLGTVVVRQALFVDPTDAHVTVVSDPIPTILEGVPLRIRSINVDINRPGFVINPTSCGEKQIKATMTSIEGATHTAVQRFQVGDCRVLPLKPRLAMRLTGRKQMTDGKHPGLRAVLTQGGGQANLKQVAVKLPLSLALDPNNAQALCEYEDGLAVKCPPTSIIGFARAITPVLNRPLEGPVYFVKGVRFDPNTGRRIRTLPTLLIPLRGEVAIDLRAQSDVKRAKLVSTFPTIPDAPVSRFELSLKGGKGGILAATRSICRKPKGQIADAEIDGQNGKRADQAVRIKTPCPKRKDKKPARRRLAR
jgi:hypothetical protein